MAFGSAATTQDNNMECISSYIKRESSQWSAACQFRAELSQSVSQLNQKASQSYKYTHQHQLVKKILWKSFVKSSRASSTKFPGKTSSLYKETGKPRFHWPDAWEQWAGRVRRFGVGETNDRRERLLEFAHNHKVTLVDNLFPHKIFRRTTWHRLSPVSTELRLEHFWVHRSTAITTQLWWQWNL